MAATYEPIATSSPSSAASVTFSGISGTYTDLIVVYAMTSTTNSNDVFARFNGDTGSNYSATRVWGNGTSALSDRVSNANKVYVDSSGYMSGDGRIALGVFQVMSYANSNVYKTVLANAGAAAGGVDRVVSLWRSTSAVTSVEIFPAAGTMSGTISLYGIKAA